MKENNTVSDAKIKKLAKKLAKSFSIDEDEAMGIIYDDWEMVESLFLAHKKVKAVLHHMTDEMNHTYRIA